MFVNYQTTVDWDSSLRDVGFVDSDTMPVALLGLAICAVKITTGAPSAIAGRWIPSAIVFNAIDGTIYQMTGTTASPAWTLQGTGSGGITQLTGDVTAGPGTGSVAATIANLAVTTAKIAADAVTTAKILNANVTLAKLASGITPSHIVKFASASVTTVGGAASENFTVTGALVGDIAFVQLVNEGTNTIVVKSASVTAPDTLTVDFTNDPGNDAVFAYQILRAAV